MLRTIIFIVVFSSIVPFITVGAIWCTSAVLFGATKPENGLVSLLGVEVVSGVFIILTVMAIRVEFIYNLCCISKLEEKWFFIVMVAIAISNLILIDLSFYIVSQIESGTGSIITYRDLAIALSYFGSVVVMGNPRLWTDHQE